MTPDHTNTELTPAERRAYAALRRDGVVDAAAEERTVAALRASGLLPGGRRRYSAIAGVAAAIIVAVIGTSSVLIVRTHPRAPSPKVVPAPESIAPATPMYVVWY